MWRKIILPKVMHVWEMIPLTGGTVGPDGKGAEQGIENDREYPGRTAPEYLTGKIGARGRDKSKLEMMRHGL